MNRICKQPKKSYKHIFFDLDRTLWDFEQNMTDALRDIYFDFKLDNIIPNAGMFIDRFMKNNDYLWEKYRKGELKKDILRFKRFEISLQDFGIADRVLAQRMGEEYLAITPNKTALIPHTREVLDYLSKKKYHLHIISNGFNEVQLPKLERCHIACFFDWIVTSEASGFHKPSPEAFGWALSKANARKDESIMIGDDLEIDILGAKKFGMDHVYFNPDRKPCKHKLTHEIDSLLQLKDIL